MILVVDHDPEVFDKAREVLSGRHVLAASRAERALAMVRRLPFSVVLVDLDLPDDAVALIRKLHETSPGLPLIAVSASAKATVPAAMKPLGVVEVLPKPVSPAWRTVVERASRPQA